MKILTINNIPLALNRNFNNNYQNKPNKKINFKGGLNDNFISYVKNIDVKRIEQNLKRFGVNADFEGNKIVAACSEKTAYFFRESGLFQLFPTKISIKDLDENTLGQCYKHTREINFNRNYFGKNNQSIELNLKEISNRADKSKSNQFQSSNNFLHAFIHEFGHSIHFANLTDKYHWNKTNEILAIMDHIQLNSNAIIRAESEYATTDVNEFVAENIARRFSLAVNSNLELDYNPMSVFKDSKELSISEELSKDRIIRYRLFNAAWNGNVKEVINIIRNNKSL